jgi:hypothetical protein
MTSLYQRLQQSGNPVAALEVVTDLIEKGKTNSEIAHIMDIPERWTRTLAKRKKDGFPVEKMLGKRGPRSPYPKRTKPHVEAIVLETQKKTNMGARRLARELAPIFSLTLSPYTIRNILWRNNRRSKMFLMM